MPKTSQTSYRWLYAGKAGMVSYNKMFNHRDPIPERCRDLGHDGLHCMGNIAPLQ